MKLQQVVVGLFAWAVLLVGSSAGAADWIRDLQTQAVAKKTSPAIHWGPDPQRYSTWTSHSNRLIPVYTFGTRGAGPGIDLASYTGANSLYRDEARVRHLYRGPAEQTVNAAAEYCDQTNIFDLQLAALEAGKRHIFLVVFDGMDWHTTQAAAIWNTHQVPYSEGRGRGTHFQEYTAQGTTQFGLMVTSPCRDDLQVNVNTQTIKNPHSGLAGGYCVARGGVAPWAPPSDIRYLIAGPDDAALRHAYTDSSSSGTSMNAGIKTFNGGVNVDHHGQQQMTIAHRAQQAGYRLGVVTSVPLCHATPAATYAHNVSRDDYQDLSRDLLGLKSVSHPETPLPGVDVLIGAGYGVEVEADRAQGKNFVPGNMYLTQHDRRAVDVTRGGRYVVAERTAGAAGKARLLAAARQARETNQRLLGFFGVHDNVEWVCGTLPFASADGDYQPSPGVDGKEIVYTSADLHENPQLADMAAAALEVLGDRDEPFWLMLEAGEVDWANHANNLDASIGAVNSGDAAVKTITDWVELHSNWNESVLIVTADHGHYLWIDKPELLVPQE